MKLKNITRIFTLLIITAGCGFADALYITLDSPIVIAPGGTVEISGTIGNNTASTLDLNSISVSLAGMFSEDESPFLFGPPTVGPNGQTGDFELLTVTLDNAYNGPLGTQTGTITILGGLEGAGGYDPTTQNVLGSVSFGLAVTPEPSNASLLSLGAFLVISAIVGKRFRTPKQL